MRSLTLAVAVVIGAGATWLLVPREQAREVAARLEGAFVVGGVPVHEDAIDRMFAGPFTTLVIAADREREGHAGHAESATAAASAMVRASGPLVARDPWLAFAWYRLLGALDGWRRARGSIAELEAGAREVSRELAAHGLGYVVDAEGFGKGHAAVFAYRVERVAIEYGPAAQRVLELRRVDRASVEPALLGRLRDDGSDPVVLLDQIDELVTDKLIPSLAANARYPLGDADWHATTSGARLERAAGAAIRREAEAALGPITSPAALAALVAATVRRHEARHAIDRARAHPLRLPKELADALGPARSPAARQLARRTRAELSAYLGQIIDDRATPQLALWNLAGKAFARRAWGSAESYVALLVLGGLACELGACPEAPLVEGGSVHRDRLAALALPLAALTDDELRGAARALWFDFYGERCQPIVEGPVVDEPVVAGSDARQRI